MLILLAAVGAASQIHPMPVSLEEVVRSSPTIVLVQDAAPPHRDIQLPAGSTPMGVRMTRVEVVEVVRAPDGQLSPQQVIEVGPAHLQTELSVHQMYYDEGIAESPIYETYEGGAPNSGPRVLLLQPCAIPGLGTQLCFSVTGSIAPPSALPTIRALLSTP